MQLKLSYLYQLCGEAVAIDLRAAPNRAVHLTSHSWSAASGEPYADLNQALVDAGSDAEAQLGTLHQMLAARKLPALYFLTAPVAEQLAPTATALGMTFAGKVPVMVCDATHLPTMDIGAYVIKPVTTAAEQASVCAILAGAFGLSHAALQPVLDVTQLDGPGLTAYLAYQDEQPIGTVATTVSGPVVGVWSMGTLPAYQRRGVGRALLGQIMAQQQARGANTFYLWSTTAGQRLYEQLGYRTVDELAVWTTGASVQVPG